MREFMGEDVLARLPGAIAKAESLPSPPTVAVEVLRVANDETATVNEIAEILSRDPVLSAKTLKLANSSMFRRGDAVTSIDSAALRLGMKTVKLMALSFSLSSDFPRKGDGRGFDYLEYWRRSLTMAVAGRSLARLVKNPSGDEAFLCGLLGRLGQLVMAQCIPERYEALVEQAGGGLPTAALESEALGYEFHEVGAALLRSWELPEPIWRTVHHWGEPDRVSEDQAATRQLARIMHLADVTTTVICSPPRRATALQTLHTLGARFLGVSPDEIDVFIVGLEQDVAEMAEMLNVDVARHSYQAIVDRARMEMVQLSLGTAIELQQSHDRTEALEKEKEELSSRANTDKLTGIPNRAHFDAALDRVLEARLAGASENALGLLMLDVDHFKKFNDSYGHPVGDEVLKLVAGALVAATRGTDIAARYGGEEFAVIVPNTTLDVLETIAERIRSKIASCRLEHQGRELSVTASVGGACVRKVRAQEEAAALVALADACLYEAKGAGRNRSVCREVEIAS